MSATIPVEPPRSAPRTALDVVCALVCVALAWTLVGFGLSETEGAVERRHLAGHAALVLAFLALPWARTLPNLQRPPLWAWTTPFLALILLPAGLRRFTPVVLVALCVIVLATWLRQPQHEATSGVPGWIARLATWAAAGVSVALLMRPDTVPVPIDVAELLGVVLRGGVLGAAAAWLAAEWRERDQSAALCVAGAALVVSGPSATAALVLAAVAGSSHWMRRRTGEAAASAIGPHSLALLPWVPLAALAPSAAAILGFGVWGARVRRGWLAALIVTTALSALFLTPRPWSETAVDLGFAALLFGPIWLARVQRAGAEPTTRRLWTAASATALAVVGLRFFPAHLILVPVAVQILRPAPGGGGGPLRVGGARDQAGEARTVGFGAAWISSWSVAVVLLASYPWMRPPLLAAQWRWALDGDPRILLTLLGLGTLAALLVARLAAAGRSARIATSLLCAVLTAGAMSWREPLGADLLQRWPPRTLNEQTPVLEYPLDAPARIPDAAPTLWIDGATAASLDLPFDTEIASIRVDLPSGRWQADLVLGPHVWDWRLPPPRTRNPDAGPPTPLFFWWTGPDDDTVLARRYRTRLELERVGDGAPPWRLRIERNAALVGPTTLEVHQVAIRGASAPEGTP